TVCLKFIEALFRRKHDFFLDISFKTAQFTFTGGQIIRLERLDETGKQAAEGAPARSICYTLHIPGKDSHSWTPAGIDSRLRREFRRFVPAQWEQVSPDLWIDQNDGAELTFSELTERYHIPPKLAAALQEDFPDDFATLLRAVDCHLIETQRLLVLPSVPV